MNLIFDNIHHNLKDIIMFAIQHYVLIVFKFDKNYAQMET